MFKWGFLGSSAISWTMAQAVQSNKRSKLYAVSGRNPANLAKIKQAFNFEQAYSSTEQLLADPQIDVVYIGLPTHLHARAIMQAARENKAILCEKSLTLNWASANAALNIVTQEKVFFMEALMYRCHAFFEKIVQTVQENAIGNIVHIEAMYHADIHQVANPLGGGTIFNLGCYPLSSVLQFCMGDVRLTPELNTSLRAAAKLSAVGFQNQKLTANISTADDLPFAWKFIIQGTTGTLEAISNPWLPAANSNTFKLHFQNKPEQIVECISKDDAYTAQIAKVIEALETKQLEASGCSATKAFSLELMRHLDVWQQLKPAETNSTQISTELCN